MHCFVLIDLKRRPSIWDRAAWFPPISRFLAVRTLPPVLCAQCFLSRYAPVQRTGGAYRDKKRLFHSTLKANFVKISLKHEASLLVFDVRNGTFLFLKRTN